MKPSRGLAKPLCLIMKSKTAKPTIAVDIDDVLAAEKEAMRLFVNQRYGLDLKEADFNIEAPYWGYWEAAQGIDQKEGRKRYEAFLESGVKAKLNVLRGATDAIKKLEQDYELVIVTSRDDSLMDLTEHWLEDNFPSIFNGVEFVHVWTGDKKANKATICKKIGAQYLIDDNLEHCEQAAEVGIKALLFGDYGWNRGEKLPKGGIRANDWQAVSNYFNETIKK